MLFDSKYTTFIQNDQNFGSRPKIFPVLWRFSKMISKLSNISKIVFTHNAQLIFENINIHVLN